MLSKTKLTFSLTSFIVLIAFGLVCAVPSAFADGDENVNHYDIGVTLAAGETMVDVSAEDGFQIATGRDRSEARPVFVAGQTVAITFTVTFSKGAINLWDPDPTIAVDAAEVSLTSSQDAFGLDDLFVEAFDREGRSLGAFSLANVALIALPDANTASLTAFQDAGAIGRKFLVRIDENQIANAYVDARGGTFEIYKLSFFMPRAIAGKLGGRRVVSKALYGVKNAALDHFAASFDSSSDADKDNSHAHYNGASNVFTLDLVDNDEGDANYRGIVTNSAIEAIANGDTVPTDSAAAGRPGVVAVIQALDRTAFQPIVTGPFNVRIILTEEPKDGLTTDLIEVVNGTAATVTKGLSLKGAHAAVTGVRDAQVSELNRDFINYYVPDGGDIDEAPDLLDPTTTLVDDYSSRVRLPDATGRDNLYHQYTAVITPNGGLDGYVTVSIKGFADNVLPVSKMYVPLASTHRDATVLSGDAEDERNARLANESVMVKVKTDADTTSTGALAKAAYETRSDDDADDADGAGKNGVFDLNPNLKQLTSKLVIPTGGYLVLVSGTEATSGVKAVAATTVGKLTAAQKLYNVAYEFPLQFPADDLDNFFRNGGSISLVYADIPAATGSGTDESKGPTAAADLTGYTLATTNAYAAGAVIISEVMWGLDAGGKGSQYIELHNTTAADIGIDHLEWAIAVGTPPAPFAAIDTVNNNPATGYWAPPGNGGVTAASTENPTIIDLVSMSRVTGGTDGTAAASWAASMRPSANLSGRRIGSPGAANTYVMPAPPADPTVEPVTPAAAVAKAGDLMISEIMVASNDGRLPQWIEIANVSAAAVSVSGWSLEVENDSADADVVGEGDTIVIDLGDVEIGADQVALVVTKEGRDTSGIGDGEGDLRADRIINVQSDVSPDNARYSLISEMGFTISLIPPQTGAVRKPGDVVGNLEGGWELPASEGDRSSLIRREMGDAGEIMGTDAAGWVLASDTMLDGAYLTTYYGSADDMGTPGYNAGGNLPVELSGFGAKRDPLTGAVVITWSTQSELNNAGFFIKRSQQTKGKFVVVNPTMIAGAGTTAEKQSYTYTDATAEPNIVYYYQIEDVSLDGNRQTLTRAHRLKGHIGAAGKATTTWGDLKSSRD